MISASRNCQGFLVSSQLSRIPCQLKIFPTSQVGIPDKAGERVNSPALILENRITRGHMTDRERVFILRQSVIDFLGCDVEHLAAMRDVLNGMAHQDEAQAAIGLIDAVLLTGPE